MSLADALEAAASALPAEADAIRPANGDPAQLLRALDPAAAPRVLAWLLDRYPAEGAELAEAWAGEETGVAAVLAVPEATLPKAGRKALRRLRHRLRSRGVAVGEAPPAPVVAKLPAVDEVFQTACASALDPGGARMVYLVEPNPHGGVRMFEVVIDDARGVVGFELYTTARKQVRQFLGRLAGGDRFPVVEVSPASARALVAFALERQVGTPPSGFQEWRRRIASRPGEGQLPGEIAREALGESAEREALERAAELVREGRVGPWPPGGDVLQTLLERIRTALDSPLVVSKATKHEQVDRLLGDAQEEIYGDPGVALAVHRFRESAFVFWKRDDLPAARACLAAAAAFESGAPRDNPVARALLEVPLAPALRALADRHEGKATQADEKALLAKP